MDTHDWKIAVKNTSYMWGFLLLFILFDVALDFWTRYGQNWILVLSLILLMASLGVASRGVRKMNSADKFRELSKIIPEEKDKK